MFGSLTSNPLIGSLLGEESTTGDESRSTDLHKLARRFMTGTVDRMGGRERMPVQVGASSPTGEDNVSLRFVGIDPNTDDDHCPTVWVDVEAGELIIQGWKASAELKAACESNTPANGGVPDYEEIIRVPARMVRMIMEACKELENSTVQ